MYFRGVGYGKSFVGERESRDGLIEDMADALRHEYLECWEFEEDLFEEFCDCKRSKRRAPGRLDFY